MRKVLAELVKPYVLKYTVYLLRFLRQYAFGLILCITVSIALLVTFVDTYKSVSTSSCSRTFTIATNLEKGVINQCSSVSRFDAYINDMWPLLCILSLGLFLYLLNRGAKVQIIHRKQWSWFRLFIYIFYGTILALSLLNKSLKDRKLLLGLILSVAVVHLFLFFLYWFRRNSILEDTFHYANATIGLKDDLLDFHPAADNFRVGLTTLDLPVQVIAITGGMGEGKSTFWRMIAEGFDKNKTLHTYISLTETNSTTDFSKLFSERWFETLKERYAFLLSSTYTEESRLYKILRGTGNGLVRLFAEAILVMNVGLFRTKTQTTDLLSEVQNKPYVSKDVSKIFNNIPELYEEQWFIVVDELERAPIQEVYRLIEVIERFKQLGKDGLPTRVIFVLCYDASYFEVLKDMMNDSSPEAMHLVQNFLTNKNRKSVDIVQKVPNPTLNRKLDLITKKLKDVLPPEAFDQAEGELKYQLLDGLYDIDKDDFSAITPQFGDYQKDYTFKEVFDYLVLKMVHLPVRSNVRLITQQLRFFINAFTNDKQEWLLNVNLSTFLSYEYIRLVRPEFLPFIEASYGRFDPDLKSFYTMGNAFLGGFNEEENKKRTLKEKIVASTGIDVSLYTDEQLEEMISELNVVIPVVSKYMVNNGLDPYENNVTKYKGTLSDPDTLKWIIAFSRSEQTDFGKFTKLYDRVAQGISANDFPNAQDLVDFSGFSRNRVGFSDKSPDISLTIAKTIYDYMTTVKDLIQPSSLQMDKNVLDSLTYEFVFQIQEAAFGYEIPETVQESAAGLFDEFMRSEATKYESKLIALDAFVNPSGSGLDRVRTREEVFEKYRAKNYFIDLFDEMKRGIVARYSKEHSPINIYNQEANVFYVQYQFWNGVIEDPFLDEMRAVAKKGLTNNARGLSVLWEVYPYNSGWKTYADLTKARDLSPATMMPSRRGMYVKLKEMLAFTKKNRNFQELMAGNPSLHDKIAYWQDVYNQGEYTKQEANLQPANDTVGAHIRNLCDHLNKPKSSL